MVDSLFQLGQGSVNFPAYSHTLPNGNVITVPVWLTAGLRTYVAAVMNSAAAANKHHLLLFNNTTPPGLHVRIWDIKVNPNITAIVTGTSLVLSILKATSIGTGATATAPRRVDSNDAAIATTDIAYYANPTAPTTVANTEICSATILVEETAGTEGRTTLWKAESVLAPITLHEGEGLTIQQGSFAGVGAINVFVYFTVDN